MNGPRFTVVPLVAAMVLSLIAGGAAAPGLGLVATPFAILAAVAAGVGVVFQYRTATPSPPELVERAARQADGGRRLVIYERETGLFAQWYVALRGQEECDRARRYDHPLMLLVIEPARPEDAWEVKDRLAQWCAASLRATDITGYSGNGRYVVLMPETDAKAARHALERLLDGTPEVVVGLSEFAADGSTFAELYRAAAERLAPPDQRRAAA